MRGINPKKRVQHAVEKSSELADSFTDRLQQSWRIVAAGAALLLSVSLLMLWLVFSNTFAKDVKTADGIIPSVTSTAERFERALDGVIVESATSTNLLPFAVMVENSADAWPLSGPSKANLVYEVPVEGSITRFMLVFDPTNDVGTIGPVRSARPYYVDWADGLGAMYAHVGGSPAALADIRETEGFRDLDQFWNAQYYWRSANRYAPHNVFTKTEYLISAAEKHAYEAGEFRMWSYEDTREQEGIGEGTDEESDDADETSEAEHNHATDQEGQEADDTDYLRINIPYEGVYRAHWEYDPDTGFYTRSQNGSVQRDADGTTVQVRNVVVIKTFAYVLDREGRLNLGTKGRGQALVFHDGKKYEGEWKRMDGEHVRFEAVDGRDIPFARGTTWISVLTSNAQFWNVIPRE